MVCSSCDMYNLHLNWDFSALDTAASALSKYTTSLSLTSSHPALVISSITNVSRLRQT
jgi:hypothetical protein